MVRALILAALTRLIENAEPDLFRIEETGAIDRETRHYGEPFHFQWNGDIHGDNSVASHNVIHDVSIEVDASEIEKLINEIDASNRMETNVENDYSGKQTSSVHESRDEHRAIKPMIVLLARQWDVLLEKAKTSLVFDIAYEEMNDQLRRENVPILSKSECRKVWDHVPKSLGISPRIVKATPEHAEIIRDVFKRRGASADRRESYKEASLLFANAGLPYLSLRAFENNCVSLERFGKKPNRYSRKHSQVVKALVLAHPKLSRKLLYELALKELEYNNLAPIRFATFCVWCSEIKSAHNIARPSRKGSLDKQAAALLTEIITHEDPNISANAVVEKITGSGYAPSEKAVKSALLYKRRALRFTKLDG